MTISKQLCSETKMFHGKSEKPETMEKYWRAIPKLTAISERTKRIVHKEDTQKHNDDYPGLCKKGNKAVDSVKPVIREKR